MRLICPIMGMSEEEKRGPQKGVISPVGIILDPTTAVFLKLHWDPLPRICATVMHCPSQSQTSHGHVPAAPNQSEGSNPFTLLFPGLGCQSCSPHGPSYHKSLQPNHKSRKERNSVAYEISLHSPTRSLIANHAQTRTMLVANQLGKKH
jgi:hypothetical protein